MHNRRAQKEPIQQIHKSQFNQNLCRRTDTISISQNGSLLWHTFKKL